MTRRKDTQVADDDQLRGFGDINTVTSITHTLNHVKVRIAKNGRDLIDVRTYLSLDS